MTLLSTLVVKIIGDVSEYSAALEKTSKETESFSSRAVGGLSAIGGGIVAGALTAGAAGMAALGKATWDATQEAMAAQKVQAQLEAVLKSTGGAAGVSAKLANDLATQYGNLTLFEDDAVLSGENMLLTFTNIGKDVFPDTTKVMLDMSQALGQDLTSSAMQLGKALNDPVKGVTALQRVGVTFTDSQKDMIKAMADAGDTAGAQKIILAELNKEFGGSAEAAGNTAGGVWERLNNIWKNVLETLGTGLLPTITNVGQSLATYLANPETQANIQTIAEAVAAFAQNVISYLPQVLEWFKMAFGWLQENQGLIAAALAMIAAALVAFAVTSLGTAVTAFGAFVAGAWPVILVLGLIGGAAYLLYEAWTNNWGGIQEKTAAVWAWLEPKLTELVKWLQTNIPAAIQAVSDYWNKTLLPAIKEVWGWIDEHLMPLFKALGELIGTIIVRDLKNLGAAWDLVKEPLGAVAGLLQDYVVWAFGNLMNILETVAPYLGDYVAWAFGNLTGIIDGVTQAIKWMSEALSGISLPEDLTPGSPTPFEMGLRGIGDALDALNGAQLPAFKAGLELQPVAVSGVGNGLVSRKAESGYASGNGSGFGGGKADMEMVIRLLQQIAGKGELSEDGLARAVRNNDLRTAR